MSNRTIKIGDSIKKEIIDFFAKKGNLNIVSKLENNSEIEYIDAKEMLKEFYNFEKSLDYTKESIPQELALEFNEEFDKIQESIDNLEGLLVEKPDWDLTPTEELTDEQLLSGLETCVNKSKLREKIYHARDMRKIGRETIDAVNYMKQKNIFPDLQAEAKEIAKNIEELLSLNITDIEKLENEVDSYNEIAQKVWDEYLSDPSEEDKNNHLIHAYAGGQAIEGDYKGEYLSTSLITNKAMGTLNSRPFGVIVKPKRILLASEQDTYTNNREEDKKKITTIRFAIKLPQQIEEEMLRTCKEVNGEMLNADVAAIYSEVVLDGYEEIGIFLLTAGEKQIHHNYEEASKLAEKKGLPFKEIDVSKARLENGLTPLTTKMKKQVCKEALLSYSNNLKYDIPKEYMWEYGDSFVENNYEDFAERFLKVKEKEDYTAENIAESFRELILDNIVKTKNRIISVDDEKITHQMGHFNGKISEEEFKYILSKRYDLSKCEDKEEFKQKISELRTVVLKCNYHKEFIEETFKGGSALLTRTITEEEIDDMFDSGKKDFSSVVGYINSKNKEKVVEQLQNCKTAEEFREVLNDSKQYELGIEFEKLGEVSLYMEENIDFSVVELTEDSVKELSQKIIKSKRNDIEKNNDTVRNLTKERESLHEKKFFLENKDAIQEIYSQLDEIEQEVKEQEKTYENSSKEKIKVDSTKRELENKLKELESKNIFMKLVKRNEINTLKEKLKITNSEKENIDFQNETDSKRLEEKKSKKQEIESKVRDICGYKLNREEIEEIIESDITIEQIEETISKNTNRTLEIQMKNKKLIQDIEKISDIVGVEKEIDSKNISIE